MLLIQRRRLRTLVALCWLVARDQIRAVSVFGMMHEVLHCVLERFHFLQSLFIDFVLEFCSLAALSLSNQLVLQVALYLLKRT